MMDQKVKHLETGSLFRVKVIYFYFQNSFIFSIEIADQIEFLYGDEYIDDAKIIKMLDADEIFQMLDDEDKMERIMAIRRKLELKKLKMIKLQKLKAQLNVLQGKGIFYDT